jgi:transposase
VFLRHYLEQQYSVTAIAAELGCHRRTIQRWIAAGDLDRDPREARYGPRAPVPTKLDPHKTLIRTRLDTYPLLTAVRLFEEVRAGGYTGSLTQLKAFVRQVRPVPEPEPPNRFETEPGLQAQVDFADVRLPWGKRYALVVVLGYSRLRWVQCYPRQTMRILLRGLEDAFHFLRGVPRELLFRSKSETSRLSRASSPSREVYAGRPDRLRRRHQPVRVRRQQSRQLHRSLRSLPAGGR